MAATPSFSDSTSNNNKPWRRSAWYLNESEVLHDARELGRCKVEADLLERRHDLALREHDFACDHGFEERALTVHARATGECEEVPERLDVDRFSWRPGRRQSAQPSLLALRP